MTQVLVEGKTATELNANDALACDDTHCFTKPGHRKAIYSDRTGHMRRLIRSSNTGRPIVEEWNDIYHYWATVASPSEAWARSKGLH